MTASSTVIARFAPLETTHFKSKERISFRAVETRGGFFETAGRYAVQTAAITMAVALPVLAIANGMGTFSSGQSSDAQGPTFFSVNHSMAISPVLDTSSACTQNLALGIFGTLLTQSFWPMFSGLFGCVPGTAAQTTSPSGSGSSSSNPVLICNNANILSYTVGQTPVVVDDAVTVKDSSTTNGLLAEVTVDTYNPDTLTYNSVSGLSVVEKRDPASMTNGALTLTVTPIGPRGSLEYLHYYRLKQD